MLPLSSGTYPGPTPPHDATKKEHIGRVSRFRIAPDRTGNNPWLVAMLHDGVAVSGEESEPEIEVGQSYRFMGRWQDHPKFGWQFKFSTYALQEPAGRTGVVRYLTQLCDGIGKKRAVALYDRYGGDAVRTLREEPGRVADDGVLSRDVAEESARQLAESATYESTKLALFDLFAGRGFYATPLVRECIGLWGAKAPDVIKEDPFALMLNDLTSCGFKRCDKLYLELKHDPLALKRQMLAGWHALHTDGSGHTWHPVQTAVRAIREAIGDGAKPEDAVLLGVSENRFRPRRDAANKLWIAETRHAANEQAVATGVLRLLRYGTPDWPEQDVGRLSEHQQAAIDRIREKCVGILIGSPGTGKTFSAAALIRQIIAKHGEEAVAVAAPTGKAAVRCTQAMDQYELGVTATTIHRLLGLGRASFVKNDQPAHGPENPLEKRFVVIDEASMLDTDLAAALFNALTDGTHLLLIGDTGQLPPVGHGSPLRDLIAAGVPTGELTEIRRNAGMIVRACAAIKNGQPFETADRYDEAAGHNLRVVDCPTPAAAVAALECLVERLTVTGQFHPVRQTQILTPLNDKSEISRRPLNDRLQRLLNPDGKSVPPNPFRIGDKIICLKNGTLAAVELGDETADPADPKSYREAKDDWGGKVEVYVANGEIGFVEAVGDKVTVARFGEADKLVRIPMGKQRDEGDDRPHDDHAAEKGRGCNFDLAYAISVHKSQGSESPCVVVIVDEQAGRIATRELHYTAISRASKYCVVLGRRAVLEKQAKRVSLNKRQTFLAELVREGMERWQTDR